MAVDPSVAWDDLGVAVRDHPLLARPVDEDTVFWTPLRLRGLCFGERTVDALEEHWAGDGLRGHTLVFLSADVADVPDRVLREVAAATFGIDLQAPREAPHAGAVSVKRSASGFTYVTGAFFAEYDGES